MVSRPARTPSLPDPLWPTQVRLSLTLYYMYHMECLNSSTRARSLFLSFSSNCCRREHHFKSSNAHSSTQQSVEKIESRSSRAWTMEQQHYRCWRTTSGSFPSHGGSVRLERQVESSGVARWAGRGIFFFSRLWCPGHGWKGEEGGTGNHLI
jgi:hypothetical protein